MLQLLNPIYEVAVMAGETWFGDVIGQPGEGPGQAHSNLATEAWDFMRDHKLATTVVAAAAVGTALYLGRSQLAELLGMGAKPMSEEMAGVSRLTEGMDQPGSVGALLKEMVSTGRYGYTETAEGLGTLTPKPLTVQGTLDDLVKSGRYTFDPELHAYLPRT
jgi:hypothetical protein